MSVEKKQPYRRFVLNWTLLTMAGLPVGVIIAFILVHLVEPVLGPTMGKAPGGSAFAEGIGGAIMAFGLGAAVGFMQWLMVRNKIGRSGWWILATAGGLAVAGFIGGAYAKGSAAMEGIIQILGYVFFLGLGGAAAGFFHWLLLRKQVSKAGWWILANALAWAFGILVVGSVSFIHLPFFVLLASAGGGIVLGVITGGTMIWLLKKPVSIEPMPEHIRI